MSNVDNLMLDAAELQRLVELTERRRVKDILTIEVKKIETEISRLREKGDGAVLSSNKSTLVSKRTGPYDVKVTTYAWDQSDTAVKVFVTLPKVETLPKEKIRCTFKDTSFELRVDELDDKNHILSISNLHSPIKTEECSWKVKTGMVIVTLPKGKKETWADLKYVESKLAKKPPKFDDQGDPQAGIMSMMQQMYNDGDDEMKRTISKAWYESREKNMNVEM